MVEFRVRALLMAIVIYIVVPKEVIDQRFIILFVSITPLVAFGPIAEIGSTYYQVKQRPWEAAIRPRYPGYSRSYSTYTLSRYMKLGVHGMVLVSIRCGHPVQYIVLHPDVLQI